MRCYLSVGSVFVVLRGVYYITPHLCQKLGVAMTVTEGSEAETTADDNSKTMVYISFDVVSHCFELWRRNKLEPRRKKKSETAFSTFNPLTAEWALRALKDFTLSNVRRFYSSMGNPLAGKGLTLSILAGSLTYAHRNGNPIAENELPKSQRSCFELKTILLRSRSFLSRI